MPRKIAITLDKTKEFSKIRNTGNNPERFYQDGRYFNGAGEFVREDADRKSDEPEVAVPQAAKVNQEELRAAALKAAADRLGKLGKAGPPQAVLDAAKENAQALAAESLAE